VARRLDTREPGTRHEGPGERRWEPRERGLVAWLFVLVVLTSAISVGPANLAGLRTLAPIDVLETFEPWKSSAPAGDRPTNPHASDPVNGFLPRRVWLTARASEGQYPVWDEYPAGGSPLGWEFPLGGSAGPLNAPYLLAPLWSAPTVAKLLELVVSVGFSFLFLRRLRLSAPAALLGGMVFAFSAFQVVWTNWPQTHVAAFIPGLFWGVERGLQRGTLRAAVPLAFIVAFMFLGFFPAVMLWGLEAAGVYALVRVVAGRPGLRSGAAALTRLAAAVLAGLGIVAFQLLPFAGWMSGLELGYRQAWTGVTLPWEALATLVTPDAFGNPVERVYYGARDYIEQQSFMGVGAASLIVFALLWPRRLRLSPGVRGFFLLGAVACLVLIYLGGPLLVLLGNVPPFGTNSVGRLRAVLGFLLAVIAAVGFESLLAGRGEARPDAGRLVSGLAVVLLGGLVAAAVFQAARAAAQAGALGYFLGQLLPSVIVAAVAVTLLALTRLGPRHLRGAAIGAIPLLLAVEAIAFAAPFWPQAPVDEFYPVTPAHRFLQSSLGSDRVVSAERALEPGTNTAYGLRSVTAHGFSPPGWRELMQTVDPAAYDKSKTFPIFQTAAEMAGSPILDRLAARYLAVPQDAPVIGERDLPPTPDGTVRLAAGETLRFSVPAGELRAVTVFVAGRAVQQGGIAWLETTVRDGGGEPVAEGRRRLYPGQEVGPYDLPVVWRGDDAPGDGRLQVEVALTGAGDELELGADAAGEPVAGRVLGQEDGLDLAFVDGVVVYERTSALPRIRWASEAVVEPEPGARLERLAGGVDGDAVLLHGPGPQASGGGAELTLLEDRNGRTRVRIDAEGSGYLVVADAVQQDGWSVTLDGEPAELLPADHALGATYVPAGTHEVLFRFEPPNREAGWAVSALALLASVAAVTGSPGRSDRSREPDGVSRASW
jgi:hypothetical protein